MFLNMSIPNFKHDQYINQAIEILIVTCSLLMDSVQIKLNIN